MKKTLNKIDDFIDTKWFVICAALFFFIMWTSKLETVSVFILAIIIPILVTRKNGITALMVIIVMAITGISMTDVPFELLPGNISENKGSPLFFVALGTCLFLTLCAFIYHVRKYKPKAQSNAFFLVIPSVLVILPIMIGGIGTEAHNIKYSLLVVAMMLSPVIFSAIFSFATMKDAKKYISWVAIGIALIIVAEMCVFYIKTDDILESFYNKEIKLGWGFSNTIAPMMSIGFFMAMYQFAKSNNVTYFFLAAIIGISMIFSFSRGCLMLFVIACPISAIACLVVSKKKLVPVVCFSILILFFIIVFSLFWDEIKTILKYFLDKGLNESGRDTLRLAYLTRLDGKWLLGQGFIDLTTEFTGKGLMTAHSTLITCLSATGIFGLILFGYHYFSKYAILVKSRSTYNLFVGIAMFVFIGYAFFDNTFYLVYQHALIMLLLEGAKRENTIPEKAIKSKALDFYKRDVPFLLMNVVIGILLFAFGLIYANQTIYGVLIKNVMLDYIIYAVILVCAAVIFFPAVNQLTAMIFDKSGATALLKKNIFPSKHKV